MRERNEDAVRVVLGRLALIENDELVWRRRWLEASDEAAKDEAWDQLEWLDKQRAAARRRLMRLREVRNGS